MVGSVVASALAKPSLPAPASDARLSAAWRNLLNRGPITGFWTGTDFDSGISAGLARKRTRMPISGSLAVADRQGVPFLTGPTTAPEPKQPVYSQSYAKGVLGDLFIRTAN